MRYHTHKTRSELFADVSGQLFATRTGILVRTTVARRESRLAPRFNFVASGMPPKGASCQQLAIDHWPHPAARSREYGSLQFPRKDLVVRRSPCWLDLGQSKE